MHKDIPKGFNCECGEVHKYPLYVFAHWHEQLDFMCPKCDRKYTVYGGKALLSGLPKEEQNNEI